MEQKIDFLDNKLFTLASKTTINNANDFKDLLVCMYEECNQHIKNKLSDDMDARSLKALINQTFQSWDLCVKLLKKVDYRYSDLLERHSFKSYYLGDETTKKIYDSL